MDNVDNINFELQDIAQAYYNEIIEAQYNDMVQAIMAGYYEIMEEACEFDRIVDLVNWEPFSTIDIYRGFDILHP